MGGCGSGRRPRHETVDQYRTIDVRRWHQEELLNESLAFTWRWFYDDGFDLASMRVQVLPPSVMLSYRYGADSDEGRFLNYTIELEWSACPYGGSRPWFLCPASGCRRRVAILYGSDIFVCRHCLRLSYPSQREAKDKRALRRAESIRERLGWGQRPFFSHGDKPVGMHWKRYERLTDLHDQLIARYRAFP